MNANPAVPGPAGATQTPSHCHCIVCNRLLLVGDIKKCPTCQSDNTDWYTLTAQQRFALFPVESWLMVAAIISFQQWAYLFIRKSWTPSWGTILLESMPIALFAGVTALIIYAAREPLRRYALISRLKTGTPKLSLNLLAALTLLIGIVLTCIGMLASLIIAHVLEPSVKDPLMKALTPLMPMFYIPFVTAAIMLNAIHTYAGRLQQRFPAPIYCDTDRMCRVALKALADTFLAPHQITADKGGSNSADDVTHDVPTLRSPTNLEIESTHRNRTGGLDLVVREHVTVWEADQKGTRFIGKADSAVYEVSTDEWAQITRVEPRRRKIRLAIYDPDAKTGR